jgi:hypothetical protein
MWALEKTAVGGLDVVVARWKYSAEAASVPDSPNPMATA